MRITPSPLVHIVMIGWLPILLAIFALVKGHRAVIAAFLIAWLFLPMFGYDLPNVPDYTKTSATTFGVFLAALLFDSGRVLAFRPRWFDIPMALFCLVLPIITSVTNGLGLYDGLSDVVEQFVMWGLPYLLGRLYFSDLTAQRDLAIGLMLGGMVYVPLVLIEARMSPQLHLWVYGYHQHDFAQTVRFGGYRPMVFMQHGIAVAAFMATATLATFWLWMSRAVKTVWNIPLVFVLPALLGATVLCRSAGALALMAGGMGALTLLRFGKTRLAVIAMILAPIAYMSLRTIGGWSGADLVETARMIHADRAESLQTRITSENILWAHASKQPVFGWGKWGRNLVHDEWGNDVAIPDGLWIILVGVYGVVGLSCFTGGMLVGPLRLIARTRTRVWNHPAMAGAVCMSVMLAVHMIDSLFNAMINPIFVLGAGGLAGLVLAPARRPVGSRPRQGAPGVLVPPGPRIPEPLTGPVADGSDGGVAEVSPA
jgi:hypothetical protein